MLDQYDRLLARKNELDELMSDPDIYKDQVRFKQLARERNTVTELVETFTKYKDVLAMIADDKEIIESESDGELVALAEEELEAHQSQREELEDRLRRLLLPKDPNDERNVIVEIRAGTGGEESGLFAANLFRMYSKYAEDNKWRVDILNSNPTGIGGFKEIIFSVEGDSVYSKLKYESGIHRVQRVPETEASGRIHTSAVSVAIMPEADEVDVEISPNELRIDVYRSTGPGGQSVNTTDSAVRVTHIPTGLVVSCQDEKSQHKNKAKALKVLRSRLLEKAQEEQRQKESQKRKLQVGSGDRSEKIRTYNYPQGRVTDHRIGLTLYKLDQIINGALDELIDALVTEDEAERLAELSAASIG